MTDLYAPVPMATIRDVEALEREPIESRVPFWNVNDWIRHGCELDPDKPAIHYVEKPDPEGPCVTLTYRELQARGHQAANLFHSLGLGPKDVVFFLLPTMPQLYVVTMGAIQVGIAAEISGALDSALALTTDYVTQRQQFGKPLGSFQALQHRAADCFVDIELNRSLVYRVFSAWDAGQCHPAMVSAAKARTSRSALSVTRAALQLHGAIGYTDEHDIGLYYKRAIALAALYGNETNHTTQFSRLTVEE